MPGRLMMEDQSSATGSQGFKKDRSHALEVGANQGAVQLDQSHPNGPVSNGPNSVLSNGIPPEGQSNGAGLSQENLGPPPPLDQSWREGVENKSLGKLMIRTAEKCFTDLNDLLASMANQKIPQQAVQANGATPEQDTDAVSLNKKSRLMDFAQQQRERFIKTLVINDWCRDAEAFAGIIDVNAHLGRTNFCHAQATTAVGETKLAMNQAKMPNPNIEAAFELLATGKSDLPSLGYINPPKITAKELLRTLRDMNVTLATRLTLHEELPNNLNEYSIADGRATFTVPGEFAVDLAVASEDPTSPFFYIDLRFLFSPAPAQLNEQIQNYCEAEVNKAIASKGLQGCYDVLHNFVLTHKLNVLHSQTTDLVRGKWFECICVERIRRMFILSYWTGRPGRKSWIELGIGSGKTKDGGASQKTTPIIASRWFQRGVEVQNAKLDIDWHRIDLESILLQAIAKHVSSLLGHVRDDLRRLAPANTKFTADLSTSDHDPDECALTLRLPSLRAPIRLAIEPVTGQITISPSTEATRKTQERLNNDPTVDMPRRAASMLCAVALEQVNKQAENIDWKLVLDLVRQDNLRAIFGDDLWQRNVYMPSEKWGRSWAIAVTVGLRGCQWWIVQLREVNDLHHRAIINARKLRLPEASNATDEMPSRKLLLQLEKAALAEVSYTSLAMELDHLNIPHHLEKPLLILGNNRTRQWTFQTMFLNFSKLMNPTQDKNWKPWAQELVRLTHHGRDNAPDRKSERLFVRHELRLALQKKTFNELRKHLSQTSRDRDLAMNDKGGLAIRFRTPFGAPFLEQIRSKLSAIRRLDHYLEVLKSCRIKCDVATLSRLEFTYSSNPPLSAHLAFSSNDGKQTTRLRLEPPDSNPHLFVRTILEQNLNSESPEAFAHTVRILQLSLPILRTVEQLQSDHPERQSLVLHARSASWYSLKYKPPLPQITFTIRTRTKVEAGAGGGKRSVRWHVEQERTKANADSLPEELLKALRELWSSDDKHYLGLGSGVAADVEGIGIVLERIDGIVRRYQSASGSGGGDDIPPNGAAGKQEVIALD